MWIGFECETPFVAKASETRQHFFHVSNAPGFIGCAKKWQAFFELFLTVLATNPKSGSRNLRTDGVSQCAPEVTILLPNPLKNKALKLKVANVLLVRVPV